jgi:hypothetical protein
MTLNMAAKLKPETLSSPFTVGPVLGNAGIGAYPSVGNIPASTPSERIVPLPAEHSVGSGTAEQRVVTVASVHGSVAPWSTYQNVVAVSPEHE